MARPGVRTLGEERRKRNAAIEKRKANRKAREEREARRPAREADKKLKGQERLAEIKARVAERREPLSTKDARTATS